MTVQAWDETGQVPAALVSEYPWPMHWQDEIERELGMTMDFAFSKLAMIGQRVTELRIEAGLSAEPEPEMPAVAGATYSEVSGWSETEPIMEIRDQHAVIGVAQARGRRKKLVASHAAIVAEATEMHEELSATATRMGGWVPVVPELPVPTLRERLTTSLLRLFRDLFAEPKRGHGND
jgi:hypothetical protein